MDGAAARGRLDIVQTLHNTRDEGCSTDAFVEAAGNNHLHVLQWLHQFYPDKSDTRQELKAAAGNGHARVV
ncbi:hypothetical protein PHYSODRAFT_286064 [Phytophthora sojae]|uniref:Ankyrin repeat protein n=1 Tax=Phytophthora sojae (strain P6497) TaxID=1094619 RepID=G4ZCX0_PHYSP|nr:hypothetical protein PHYSODRAFT_286064 [Phytophthora sojae]EGZ18328.1 hypothetical protein PHYSODRAFT_286064 [Phytophthora sojae]|eukprot:XP_009527386.1 hypothetical protein PHYSODRAFT_286064 [Phytophthora sojae]